MINNRLRLIFLSSALGLGLVLAGCSQKAAQTEKTDGQVAAEVQNKIASDGNITSKQVTVSSNNGTVTLAGTVRTEFERTAAGNDAAQVAGVKTVLNNLATSPASADLAAAATPRVPPQSRRAPAPGTYNNYPNRNTRAATQAPPAPVTPSQPAPPVVPATVTIPDGTTLSVRTVESLSSDKNQVGDTFHATLDAPIAVDDRVAIPAGADVEGRVVELKGSGHFTGHSDLTLELTKLSAGGRSYSIHTNQWTKQGAGRGKRTAETVGGGAALGALIGGLAGGGKGAAIGAGIGAGAGTGVQAVTKGQKVVLPPESVISFRLQNAITVTPSGSRQGRPRLDTTPSN